MQPVTGHVAADRATGAALVVEQDRAVVPLSGWLADAAVAARLSGRLLQVVTGADSRLTYPLELMLRQGGGRWVVRRGGAMRDGFTGADLAWTGDRFATAGEAVSAADASKSGQSPAGPSPAGPSPAGLAASGLVPAGGAPAGESATGPSPLASARFDVPPGSGSLEVQISTLHPAGDHVELGLGTESAMRALIGGPPAGWGVAEPAGQPWSRRAVTAHCRSRSPMSTALVVVGGRSRLTTTGVLRVERTDTGVLERIRLAGPASADVGPEAVEALAAEVAGTARSMLVAVHPARAGGTLPSGPSLPALPYGVLLGSRVVAERGAAHAGRAPAAGVHLLGGQTGPAAWCRLDTPDVAPFEVLAAVLRHFGVVDPVADRP